MSEQFWMVVNVTNQHDFCGDEYIPRDDRPGFIHPSKDDAEREALRLARKTGDDFVVLEAISFTKALPVAGHYRLVDCPPPFGSVLLRSA